MIIHFQTGMNNKFCLKLNDKNINKASFNCMFFFFLNLNQVELEYESTRDSEIRLVFGVLYLKFRITLF